MEHNTSQNPFDDPEFGASAKPDVSKAKSSHSANPFDDPDFGKPAESRGVLGTVKDIGVWTAKGLAAVPEAAIGLADIPTGGRVGKVLDESLGIRPKQWKGSLNELHTDATKAAQQKFEEADGVWEKTKAAVQNPSNIAGAVIESLPSMFAGGYAGRAALAGARGAGLVADPTKIAQGASAAAKSAAGAQGLRQATVAGAAGEGLVMAGAQAEAIRQETEDGLLTPAQAGAALGTGVLGGAFGYAGGKLANKLGIGDAETMLVQGQEGLRKQIADNAATAAVNPLVQQTALKSIPRKVIEGAIVEGFLEELPQSVSEQIIQNLALGKEWYEEVDAAIVLGTLSGGAMGAGAAGYRGVITPRPKAGGEAAPGGPGDGGPAEPGTEAAPRNIGLERVSNEFAARLQALQEQEQEQGEQDVPQSIPPNGAAVLARQQAVAQEARDSQLAASRAVENPDDEILQSIGATAMQRPSVAMGLRSGPEAGAMERAAAMAVDTGAAAQLQQAAEASQANPEPTESEAMQTAAQDAVDMKSARQKVEKAKTTVDPETGEVLGVQLAAEFADWSDEQLRNAFKSAQGKSVRQELAVELQSRRARREQEALQDELDEDLAAGEMPDVADGAFASVQEDAGPVPTRIEVQGGGESSPPAPGSKAKGANLATLAQLNRKKLAEMTTDELHQLASLLPGEHGRQEKIQKAIQARATAAQPATTEGATANGATATQNNVSQDGTTPTTQAQPQAVDPKQRITDAGAQWARMPAAERSALAARLDGVAPVIAKNLPKSQWEKLNSKLQGKIADAIKAQAAPVVGDEKAFAPETGTLGIPRADMPQVPTANHGGLVKHLNAQGIGHETKTVDAAELKPTQAEYSPSKVAATKAAEGDRSVIVSSDGHIIDGHHQAIAAAEDGKQVKAIVLDAPVEQALAAVKASPSANQVPKSAVKKVAKSLAVPRAMNDEGRAVDGGPIMPGDTFTTSSGRTTSLYPKQKGERYASQWLIDNAVAEAESRGDTFNAPTFKATTLLKSGVLTDSDRESMLMYLFGEQPAKVPGILKPIAPFANSASNLTGNSADAAPEATGKESNAGASAANDRDHFTLMRANDGGDVAPVTFARGETVKIAGTQKPYGTGVITGISHAERKFRVDGQQHGVDFGYAYPADYDEFAKPRAEVDKGLDRLAQRLAEENAIEAQKFIEAAKSVIKLHNLGDYAKARMAELTARAAEISQSVVDKMRAARERKAAEDAAARETEKAKAKPEEPVRMTMEEWKAASKDFKSIVDGQRMVMREGGMRKVVIEKPNSVSAKKLRGVVAKAAEAKITEISADYLNGAVQGDTITASKDFDYVTGGKPMVIESISPRGEVHVHDPVGGGRTSFKADVAFGRRVQFEVIKAKSEAESPDAKQPRGVLAKLAKTREAQAKAPESADATNSEHPPLEEAAQDTANFIGNQPRRAGTVQDRAVLRAFADGKSTRDVLRLIANNSKDPFRREVARVLLKSGINPTTSFGHIGVGKNGKPIFGQYSGKTDTITMAGISEYAAERIFMHEAMHAATMRALRTNSLATLQMRRLLDHVRKQKGAAGYYGLTNVDEFVAEVFTNSDFQAALRQMSAPAGGTLKSAWDSFLRTLLSILRLNKDSTDALSQALDLGMAVVNQDMRMRQRGAFGRGMANSQSDQSRVDPLVIDAIQTVLDSARSPGHAPQKAVLGQASPWLVKKAAAKGMNVEGYSHVLDGSAVRHMIKNHFDAKAERSRGQIALTDSDLLALPALVASPDMVVLGSKNRLGKEQIAYIKQMPDGSTLYLEEVRTGKKELAAVSARKYPATMNVERIVSTLHPNAQSDGGNDVIVLRAHPDGNGESDVANFGADDFTRIKASALDQLSKTFTHPGKVSLWDKTVGTMRNLALRAPEFKPVFESAQRFIDDVSMLANDAADAAPRLMPRVESLGDLKKKPITAADNKAVAKPLFEGTLMWARDMDGKPMLVDELSKKYSDTPTAEKAAMLMRSGKVSDQVLKMWSGMPVGQFDAVVNGKFERDLLKPGVVWTDSELKDRFGLTVPQVSLYREARGAIDRSIDMTARTDMLRMLGDEFADLRELVLEQPMLKDAFDLVVETLQTEAKERPDMADRLLAINNSVVNRYETAKGLMDYGYAPLSRFGQYTVDVVDQAGERQYFGMFESKREANLMRIKMATVFPGATVTQGTMSQQAFKLFQGITPESLEQFGSMLGLKSDGNEAKDKAFQAYLQLAKNNHSALKRLIHRKGIDGYSEDVGRVLASFVYSNARLGSGGLNAGTMETAVEAIPKEKGELRDAAMSLRSYIQDPQEEGQAIRGFLFAQYLGGSVASAAVNMMQPFQITMPWLSQYGGMANAAKQMTRALKDMGTKGYQYEPDLAKALQEAVDDGVVSPQEIHQLMAQARGTGSLRTGDGTKSGDARAAMANNWERVKVAWGQPFALAEQFNRRSTFIAAYRTAKEQGLANPGQFARDAVLETQFVYNKANKPRWARGAIGGTLFTFKTYSVSYLELMNRMWNPPRQAGEGDDAYAPRRAAARRAVAWSVAMLMLTAGAGGLPFVEDVEDLIDGAGQMMGYNISAKQWRKEFLQSVIGAELGEFLESGMSGLPGAPIDVSGRLGLGNLIPGTGLFLSKQSRERDLLEVVGPAGDLVARSFTGARKLLTGDVAGAALEVSPTAVRNAAKGVDMAVSGMYKDTKGYKVLDTTLTEALSKAIGFQPKSVSEAQEGTGFILRTKSFYTQTSSEIRAQWADALFRKDDAALQRVRDRLAAWNRKNPDQRITIKIPDVMKRVHKMNQDRADRIADSAPRALRQQIREMSQEANR
ncbi:PLxRFG domain-containing protein [Lampropedia aestuarii]|uniref:PLxRFG domain-containing protein n=1 Tax=Lampropedia aestuarii TaxID=2562762 RepID=UPI002468A85B|nr:PLxRFG domain-containing protein [Lampropedia aestuarii]MDH5857800.1 PLxRFG domain-containing protein [Lampropedia aestuarii]